jgi:hypothetical protein
MKKILMMLFAIIVIFTVNVKAEDNCDPKELSRLKELAKKVEFDYDYELVNGQAVFSINAVNLNEDLKVLIIEDYYSEKYQEFKDSSTHTATIKNFKPGEKITVTIKAFVTNWCSGKTITTKLVKLPFYNYNYDETKCKGHEDFKYCKLLIDKDITKEEFDKQYENYLKKGEDTPKEEEKETKDYTQMYLIIGGGLLSIIAIGLSVRYIIKTKKKNSL